MFYRGAASTPGAPWKHGGSKNGSIRKIERLTPVGGSLGANCFGTTLRADVTGSLHWVGLPWFLRMFLKRPPLLQLLQSVLPTVGPALRATQLLRLLQCPGPSARGKQSSRDSMRGFKTRSLSEKVFGMRCNPHAVGSLSPLGGWGGPRGWPPPPTMDRRGAFFIYCGDPEIFFGPKSRGTRLPPHPVLSRTIWHKIRSRWRSTKACTHKHAAYSPL
jgi:hypothetical protein